MQVQQKKDYFGDATTTDPIEKDKIKINTEKMRRKLISFGKQHKEFPQMTVSFLTRAKGMEVCFGDPALDQPSIAASALRSLMSLSLNTRVLVA
jgi:hypothetical protein